VAGLFVINMMTSGLAFYAQSPYLKSLVNEEGFSNTLTSVGTGLFFLVSGITGYLSSGLINRTDVRYLMALGGVLGGIGLGLLGQVQTEWQLFAANAFFGIGFAFCGLVPANTVVTRWFQRRRSVAISVASTGLSAGGIIITREVANLVDEYQMPAVTPWLGLLWAAVIIPVAIFVVKPSPQAYGLLPDGEERSDAGTAMASSGPPPGYTFREARSTRFFRFMTAAYAFIMLSQVGALAHQNKLGSDRVSNSVGALAVSMTAGASVLGRLAGGVVVMRMPSRLLTLILIGVQGVALALLAQAETRFSLLAASLLLGLAVGNLLMLQPLLVAEAFGVREYSKVYSSSQVVTTLGVATGPILMGFLEEQSSYRLSYGVAALSAVVGLVLFLASGPVAQPAPARDQGDILTAAAVASAH
jgi:MFS family permease